MNLRPLQAVVEHHAIVVTGLSRLQAAALAPNGRTGLPSAIQALSADDLILRFERAREEAEGGAVVTLLGGMEVLIRGDLQARRRKKRLDGARLLAALQPTGRHTRLDDLIDAWRTVCGEAGPGAGSRFKHALQLRHWYAHGRAWARPNALGASVDLDVVWTVCEDFLNKIKQYDPKFPLDP